MLLRFTHHSLSTYPDVPDIELPCIPRVGETVYIHGRYLIVKEVIYPITNSFGERCDSPIIIRVM